MNGASSTCIRVFWQGRSGIVAGGVAAKVTRRKCFSQLKYASSAATILQHNLRILVCQKAGGKFFGGRMSSQAQAASPLPGVRGLVFLGFPLHPAGRPSEERGKHLFEVRTRPLKLCFLTASI